MKKYSSITLIFYFVWFWERKKVMKIKWIILMLLQYWTNSLNFQSMTNISVEWNSILSHFFTYTTRPRLVIFIFFYFWTVWVFRNGFFWFFDFSLSLCRATLWQIWRYQEVYCYYHFYWLFIMVSTLFFPLLCSSKLNITMQYLLQIERKRRISCKNFCNSFGIRRKEKL